MENTVTHTVVRTADPEGAALWLQQNLFFLPTQQPNIVCNGSLLIELIPGQAAASPAAAPGHYHTGPEHIALRTCDIAAAQAHCQEKGILLNLQDGHSHFNPKVYGEGEYYFNFTAPFGLLIEISQRAAQPHYGENGIIDGLDHIGIPCEELSERMRELEKQGFEAEFTPVHNYNDTEGNIYCCMMRRGSTVLEVYQFADMQPTGCAASACLALPDIQL